MKGVKCLYCGTEETIECKQKKWRYIQCVKCGSTSRVHYKIEDARKDWCEINAERR